MCLWDGGDVWDGWPAPPVPACRLPSLVSHKPQTNHTHNTTTHTKNKHIDASALEDTNGAQAALADSTVEGLYNNLVVAEPDGPGPRVRLAPGFEVCAWFVVVAVVGLWMVFFDHS